MATFKGKDGILRIGSVVVGECRSFEITETANEVDTSRMGTDWTSVTSTQLSWKGSAQTWWDPLDGGQALLNIGTVVNVEFYPRGIGSGLNRYTGSALITNVSRPQAFDGIVEATLEFTGTGALTKNLVP
jgi:hypothetical protein